MTDWKGSEWLMGLRDLHTKSAEDTLTAWLEIIADINERNATREDGDVSVGTKLLRSIAHTMSDKAATEMKFNRLLEAYINEVLPLIEATREEELEDEDRRIIVRLNNFFCGLHSLVHYADVCDKAANENEVTHFGSTEKVPINDPTFRKAGESAAARTVREVCKSLSRGGDEKSGVYDKAVTFFRPILKEEFDAHSLPFTPYLRNRFSIFFHNCSVLYCLYDHLIEFFSVYQSNKLLKAVLFDLQQIFFVGEIRAIAIISKLFMAPLWNAIEDRDVDLSAMNGIYSQLLRAFEEASSDPSVLLRGISPFPDKYLKKDKWWEKVFAPDIRSEAITISTLGIMLPALAIFTKKNFADHLENGKYASLKPEDVEGVPKHNKLCERVFGQWDAAKRRSPNKTELAIEAKLCFSFNNVSDWLSNLDDESRKQVIIQSRAETPTIRHKLNKGKLSCRKKLRMR